jgi:hypothetical protein
VLGVLESEGRKMVSVIRWAIKDVDTGEIMQTKYGRSLWKVKPTGAVKSLKFKHRYRNPNLVPIQVTVTEIDNDTN